MNRYSTLLLGIGLLAGTSMVAAQEAVPKPETQQERPMEQTTEKVSDAWITTKVKADLMATDGVTGTDINVDTQNGVVKLSGTVKTSAEAEKAVMVARSIKGVTRVDNQLRTDMAKAP